jgi:hypothetical protein
LVRRLRHLGGHSSATRGRIDGRSSPAPRRREVSVCAPCDGRVARRGTRPRSRCTHDGSRGVDGGHDSRDDLRRRRGGLLGVGSRLAARRPAGAGLGIPRSPQQHPYRANEGVSRLRIRLPRRHEEPHAPVVLDGGMRHSGEVTALRREACGEALVPRALSDSVHESALICLPPNEALGRDSDRSTRTSTRAVRASMKGNP